MQDYVNMEQTIGEIHLQNQLVPMKYPYINAEYQALGIYNGTPILLHSNYEGLSANIHRSSKQATPGSCPKTG